MPMSDDIIEAEFWRGEVHRFDMRPYLGFLRSPPRKDSSLFMRAHVEHGTVVWSEDIDLSPDTLYRRGLPA